MSTGGVSDDRGTRAPRASGWFCRVLMFVGLAGRQSTGWCWPPGGNAWRCGHAVLVDRAGDRPRLLAGLTVVNPNQAKVVTLFGVYKGSIKTPGLLVGESADNPAAAVAARPQLRKRQAEGQRPRRQPDRDRRRRRLAHRRHVRGGLQRRRLRALRARAERSPRCANLATTYPYDSHEDGQMSLRRRSARSASGCATRFRSGWRRPASR